MAPRRRSSPIPHRGGRRRHRFPPHRVAGHDGDGGQPRRDLRVHARHASAGPNDAPVLASNAPTFAVTPATPTVTWPSPAAITYGTPLGVAQLNAVASVPGTFTYSPPAGTVLAAGTGQVLAVAFAPSDPLDDAAVPSTATTIDVLRQATITTLAASSPATGPGSRSPSPPPSPPPRRRRHAPPGRCSSCSTARPSAPVPLSSAGTAGATITRSQLGNYTVTAVYGGDGNYQTSTSNAVAGRSSVRASTPWARTSS